MSDLLIIEPLINNPPSTREPAWLIAARNQWRLLHPDDEPTTATGIEAINLLARLYRNCPVYNQIVVADDLRRQLKETKRELFEERLLSLKADRPAAALPFSKQNGKLTREVEDLREKELLRLEAWLAQSEDEGRFAFAKDRLAHVQQVLRQRINKLQKTNIPTYA